MFEKLKEIFGNKDLRKKIIFTCLMLVIFRIGANIPVPGIDREYLSQVFENGSMGLIDIFNLFSGGSFQNFTIFALGVTPYITATIIVQLLGAAFPYFENLRKEGQEGREKLGKISRYSALGLALLQSFGYSYGFFNQAIIDKSPFNVALITMILTAGSMFLMWVGERIEEYGIGSGISILIYGGIIASLPSELNQIYTKFQSGGISFVELGLLILGALFMVLAVVYVQEGERKIPVQYAARTNGRVKYAGNKTYIPLKVNQSGVLPIIFASSFLQFPMMILMFFRNSKAYSFYNEWLSPDGTPGVYIYSAMLIIFIVVFSFFYQEIALNTKEMADNLAKNGGTVMGIRPGTATRKYLAKIANRLSFAGAIFLSIVAVIPVVLSQVLGVSLIFGGTSLLIIVGVSLDIFKRLSSQQAMVSYNGFLKMNRAQKRRNK